MTVLFAARVLGQAVQYWAPLPFLPAFDHFQGSGTPYGLLLAVQLVILGVMVRTAWQVHRQTLVRSARAARVLMWVGGIYLAGSVARIVVGMTVADAHAWFRTWIPAIFHLVLATYVLLVAGVHGRAAVSESESSDKAP